MSSFETPNPPYNSSDPSATFLSASALDFLLIELVPLAHRVSLERDAIPPSPSPTSPNQVNGAASSAASALAEVSGNKAAAAAAAAEDAPTSASGKSAVDGGSVTDGGAGGTLTAVGDEEMDAVRYRLEMQGYRVGQGLVERFSRDRPRFNDTLDVIKFLCKDLWSLVFGKNIDNLKTNHRGVYVLTDNVFRPFSRMSTETGGQAVLKAQPFLWFPCGIVRGALSALGINASVQAEINALPGAIFQIKTLASKA